MIIRILFLIVAYIAVAFAAPSDITAAFNTSENITGQSLELVTERMQDYAVYKDVDGDGTAWLDMVTSEVLARDGDQPGSPTYVLLELEAKFIGMNMVKLLKVVKYEVSTVGDLAIISWRPATREELDRIEYEGSGMRYVKDLTGRIILKKTDKDTFSMDVRNICTLSGFPITGVVGETLVKTAFSDYYEHFMKGFFSLP